MPEDRDPFAPITTSPQNTHLIAKIALILGILTAISGGVAMLWGPLGMAVGLIGHVKGSRLGMPAAIVAAIGTVIGMSLHFLLR